MTEWITRRMSAVVLAAAMTGAVPAVAQVAGTLDAGGATLAYLKQGSGPALVIVHGVGGHKEDWAGVSAALSADHTVYAIDMLGFGGSSRDAPDLTMAAQAGAIKALLDAEGVTSADLIGNSVGGWVTATFAATYPAMTDQLVLVDPAGFAAMFEGAPPVNLFPETQDEMKALLDHVLASDFAHTDKFAAQALAALDASGERSLAPRLFPALVASDKLEAVMPKITAPTLVIWGEADKLFPVALAPYIGSLTPGAVVEIIPGAAHFPQIDQPEAFIAVVDGFLD